MESNSLSGKPADGQTVPSVPIAIIGMASVFPQARTLNEYWDNILKKVDSIIDVPPSRWKIDEYYDPDPAAADKTYCKRGGFIPSVVFDPAEFGLPPNILEATDVTQLLSLVVAKECFEDAGYADAKPETREKTGVIFGFVGIGTKSVIPLMARLQYPVWEKALRSQGVSAEDTQRIIEKIKLAYPRWEENSFPGAIGNVVSGRVANRFDLGGTNCVVDAACASSLAAIRMAVGELSTGQADMMLTGGVDLDNSIGAYLCFSKTPAFSKNQYVRSFDQDADGMMIGEGIGMVLLKRLADARRDGDRVYAVIKGIGTSSDGRFKSIYAPRPAGQAKALRRAYAEAGYSPATVGLIEAHGTGTMAGDPAEFQGLMEGFSPVTNGRKQYIALGSVKSQIGHTKAAAGVASLIKTALALYHKVLPATIHVQKPNPKLDIENSPFYLNTEIRPWFKPAVTPRRAGVSSFGFGGTNFHVALEEFEDEHTKAYRIAVTPRLILFSAATPDDLRSVCKDWKVKISSPVKQAEFAALASASESALLPQSAARLGFIAENAREAEEKLGLAIEMLEKNSVPECADEISSPAGIFYRRSGIDPQGKVVALFPGQGSQYVNMGRELAVNFPTLRQAFSAMDQLFGAEEQPPLSGVVYPIPVFDNVQKDAQSELLTHTEFAQPAIGAMSVGLFNLLREAGLSASFTAGHSFGELTALWAAGVFDEDSYFSLAKARGKAMAPPQDPDFDAGTMLAVKGDISRLQTVLAAAPGITVANWNAKNQVVLAGSKPAISAIQKRLIEEGYAVVALQVSAAFHTSLVEHAQKPFAAALQAIPFHQPVVQVFSNTTAQNHDPDPDRIRQALTEHVLKPVRFKEEIETIYAQGGTVFVEIGPKNVLTNLVKNVLEGKPHHAIALNPNPKKDSDRQLREAIAQLCVLGVDLRGYDHYALPVKASDAGNKSAISLPLDGALYLTEKTRAAFKAAISEQNTLTEKSKISVTLLPQAPEAATPVAPSSPVPDSGLTITAAAPVIDRLQALEELSLKAHSQFMQNDGEYARIFHQLTQQELSLLGNNPSPSQLEQMNIALQTLDRSLAQFHQHQAETLRVHAQYLQSQSELITNLISLAQNTPVASQSSMHPGVPAVQPQRTMAAEIPALKLGGNGHEPTRNAVSVLTAVEPHEAIVSTVAPEIEKQTLDPDVLSKALLAVVSDKTGYPSEMIAMDMDMEADLGIDSIKRVEILGAIQEHFPELPKIESTALAEMRTLGQIIEGMGTSLPMAENTTHPEPVSEKAPVSQPVMPTVALDAEIIKQALLEVVSDKTGYPVEMIAMDMDMEADLGIDSIKRVEILGAIQERFPELPKIEPTALAEIRTLGQIIEGMGSSLPAPDPKQPEPVNEQMPVSLPVITAAEIDLEIIKQALLEVVSEKTGYPVEMLAMDMDMEADLGIDSIKRVEILGAMQARFPHLPTIETTELADLRTLSQIIDSLVNDQPPAAVQSSPMVVGIEEPALPLQGVMLKAIPQPDHISITFPTGHSLLLLDDGTELTPALAQALHARHIPSVVLSLPGILGCEEKPLPPAIKRYRLEDLSEVSLQGKLAEIRKNHGPASGYIHLQPSLSSPVAFPDAEKEIIRSAFLMAKLLKEDLTAAAKQSHAAFVTVTRLDGEFGTSTRDAIEPLSGGLFGLVKTLNLEWEGVFCRAIDLHPAIDTSIAVAHIVAELSDPNRLISEVSYNSQGRYTLAAVPMPQEA